MARKSRKLSVVEAARKVAAPFWQRVAEAGLDRFFLERLLRGLLRRWREDRFARVKQGGLHGDSRADLARVFIDLDATPRPGPLHGSPSHEAERIVASWMRPGSGRPGKQSKRAAPDVDVVAELRSGLSVPMEVVLGGPGQGKSTVGRFLVLIHASILLLTSPIEGITPAADIAHMEALLASLSAEDIALPETLRLPIWVELRELADGLLNDPESQSEPLAALLRWIATNDLREPADAPGLESALATLPWVLVLDGLDEVPPQRGRALVRGCVDSVRRRFAGADGRLIATSRPQSYEREVFGEALFERTLLPLVKERAEVYSTRFADCLHGEEEGQRAELLKGMRKALANPSTAALMTNPLLVTIMAAIVLHHGEPSDRRWTLFEEYYTTLYQRETERGTYASATLRQYAPLVTAIHMHVGMSLQVRSEEAEGVSALMPEQELRAIIREHLIADFSEEEAVQLTEEILRAAEQRLVLLVQSQRGMYGFELRSFQELMAAWQIVSLREAQASELLRRVAPLRAWQNVVLFAIGHQYAEKPRLARERSVELCEALDRSEEDGGHIALPGARLALAARGCALWQGVQAPGRAYFESAGVAAGAAGDARGSPRQTPPLARQVW